MRKNTPPNPPARPAAAPPAPESAPTPAPAPRSGLSDWLKSRGIEPWTAYALAGLLAAAQVLFLTGFHPMPVVLALQFALIGLVLYAIRDKLHGQRGFLLAVGAAVLAWFSDRVMPGQWVFGYSLLLLGAVLLRLEQRGAPDESTAGRFLPAPHPLQRWEPWFFVIFAGLALYLRVYHLGDLPPGCAQQEGELIENYFVNMENKPFALSTLNAQTMYQPSLTVYQAAALGKLFGFTPEVVRWVPVLYGWAAILIFYFVARQITSPFAAAAASVLYAASDLHLVLSRHFFPYSILFLPVVAAFGLFLLYLRRPRGYLLLLAGGALGLSLHGYLPGRGALLVFVAWFAVLLVLRQAPSFSWRGQLLFWSGFVITASPVLLDFARHWQANWYYVDSNANPFAARNRTLGTVIAHFAELLPTYAKIFRVAAENNYQYHEPFKPLLDPVSGMLFGLGLFLAALSFWRPVNSFLLLFFAIGMLPALMSSGHVQPFTPGIGPHPVSRRVVLALPAIYLLAGIAIERFRVSLRAVTWPAVRWLLVAAVAATLGWVGVRSFRTYYVKFATNPGVLAAYSHNLFLAGQEMRRFPGAQVLVQPQYFWQVDPHALLFPREAEFTVPWSVDGLLRLDPKRDALLILEPYLESALPFFQQIFPHAEAKVFRETRTDRPEVRTEFFIHATDAQNPLVYTIRLFVPKADIAAWQTVFEDAAPSGPRRLDLFAPSFGREHAGESLRLAGALLQLAPGEYRFGLAWPGWRLRVNGQPAPWDQPVVLPGGTNYFELEGRVPDRAPEQPFPWTAEYRNQPVLTPDRVVALRPQAGLRTELFQGAPPWAQAPKVIVQDLLPAKRFYDIPADGAWHVDAPVYARLSGALTVPADGPYAFKTPPTARVRLFLDGQEVFSNFADLKAAAGRPADLRAGRAYRFSAEMEVAGAYLSSKTFFPLKRGPQDKDFVPMPIEWLRLERLSR